MIPNSRSCSLNSRESDDSWKRPLNTLPDYKPEWYSVGQKNIVALESQQFSLAPISGLQRMNLPKPNLPSPAHSRVISGRRVVVAMCTLGILATAFLWTYWTVRMMPFMPLQEALVTEFTKASRPRAEGGHAKGTGQSVLLISMRSTFDPTASSGDGQQQVADWLATTRDIAATKLNLSEYEVLAVHLYHDVKERGILQKTFFKDVDTWKDLDGVVITGMKLD